MCGCVWVDGNVCVCVPVHALLTGPERGRGLVSGHQRVGQ